MATGDTMTPEMRDLRSVLGPEEETDEEKLARLAATEERAERAERRLATLTEHMRSLGLAPGDVDGTGGAESDGEAVAQ